MDESDRPHCPPTRWAVRASAVSLAVFALCTSVPVDAGPLETAVECPNFPPTEEFRFYVGYGRGRHRSEARRDARYDAHAQVAEAVCAKEEIESDWAHCLKRARGMANQHAVDISPDGRKWEACWTASLEVRHLSWQAETDPDRAPISGIEKGGGGTGVDPADLIEEIRQRTCQAKADAYAQQDAERRLRSLVERTNGDLAADWIAIRETAEWCVLEEDDLRQACRERVMQFRATLSGRTVGIGVSETEVHTACGEMRGGTLPVTSPVGQELLHSVDAFLARYDDRDHLGCARSWTGRSSGYEMAWIEPGTFQMGDLQLDSGLPIHEFELPEEFPQPVGAPTRPVTLTDGFWIGSVPPSGVTPQLAPKRWW